MPTRTRTGNKDVQYKVYYSKRVPKQKLFPERRKTVRPKPGHDHVVPEPKQTTLNPHKKRSDGVVEDSEDEEEEDLEDEGSSPPAPQPTEETPIVPKKSQTRGRKRKSDSNQEHRSSEEMDSPRPGPKRRRAAQRPAEKAQEIPSSTASSDSESEEEPLPRGKRQSTMTQLVNGRPIRRGEKEPGFKPVKRTPRMSRGSRRSKSAEKDRRQQTLTQMVPGLTMIGIMSDDDMEEALDDLEQEDANTELHRAAVARHQAHHKPPAGAVEEVEKTRDPLPVVGADTEHDTHQTEEAVLDEDEEKDVYEPTQYIEASITSPRRSTRRSLDNQTRKSAATTTTSTPKRKSISKYSLLATPTRRVLELRSSQSPAESELSTQTTPDRAPLQERAANTLRVEDTPSKRRQVTFQEPLKDAQTSIRKRRFGSVIGDSDEEEDEWGEGGNEDDEPTTAQAIGAETQAIIRGIENPAPARNVGSETQAILAQIDEACAHAEEAAAWGERSSEEDEEEEELSLAAYEESQELGASFNALGDVEEDILADAPSSGQRRIIKPEPFTQDTSSVPQQSALNTSEVERHGNAEAIEDVPSPRPASFAPSAAGVSSAALPTTAVFIKDECSDEEDTIHSTPPPATALQESSLLDLDGEPIQVPRSPSPAAAETQNTNTSHSSRAEHQLLAEWSNYSQHQRMRLPPPSSTNPLFPPSTIPPSRQYPHPHSLPKSTHTGISQATTIDLPSQFHLPSQPSAHTTPRKAHDAQSVISPQRPPPLVIPSSFPSPSKVMGENWSSPIFGNAPFAATMEVEDFSIPPAPPGMGMAIEGWDDDGEDEI